ncbi:thymidine phosphorylase [Endomicrobium proavitum]|nr:thymidine phosphorylase [Endomicrobium proavitum]
MRAYDIIYKKRNNGALSKEEVEFLVFNYNNGEIPDYQMSAFLMAVCFTGMTDDEIFYLTSAMINSGDVIDLSSYGKLTADKHSTGGVGDGTSLIAAPIAASAGVIVPMMAGRSLGHTGGTLDKLESIPGFRTDASKKDFFEYLDFAGAAIIGQTQEIVPADKKIYALRDATATVESIPLICSSIMSKKIAEGAKSLVLDVKCGGGAFMKNLKDAKTLASKMVETGKKFGKNIFTFVTDMNTPLGSCIGNALEVKQAIEILKGNLRNDLSELSIELSGAMIFSAGLALSVEAAKDIAQKQISSGKAIEKFRQIIKTQGGNSKVIDSPDSVLPKASRSVKIKTAKSGFISQMFARDLAIASALCGAGREKKEDKIDYSAGIILHKKVSDFVKEGEVLAELLYNNSDKTEEAAQVAQNAYVISDVAPAKHNLIKEVLF